MNQSFQNIIDGYHRWYYDTGVWQRTSFLGVPCQKSVSDLWNYQEILTERKPSLVIEFGVLCGGSSLYLSTVLRGIVNDYRVLAVDCNLQDIRPAVKADPHIELLCSHSTASRVAERISLLRCRHPGPVFVILDSDHRMDYVLEEMIFLRDKLIEGDYLVVEDGNINGHPVCPSWGAGPMEAIVEYKRRFPNDYVQDSERELKFGFTFAPKGFLIRAVGSSSDSIA